MSVRTSFSLFMQSGTFIGRDDFWEDSEPNVTSLVCLVEVSNLSREEGHLADIRWRR